MCVIDTRHCGGSAGFSPLRPRGLWVPSFFPCCRLPFTIPTPLLEEGGRVMRGPRWMRRIALSRTHSPYSTGWSWCLSAYGLGFLIIRADARVSRARTQIVSSLGCSLSIFGCRLIPGISQPNGSGAEAAKPTMMQCPTQSFGAFCRTPT